MIAALIVAALFEVSGDYVIRVGITSDRSGIALLGATILGAYGFAVNWYWRGDFSTLLGIYVVAFFLVSQVWGCWADGDAITPLRWLGIILIVAGGFAVHYSAAPQKLNLH